VAADAKLAWLAANSTAGTYVIPSLTTKAVGLSARLRIQWGYPALNPVLPVLLAAHYCLVHVRSIGGVNMSARLNGVCVQSKHCR